MEAVGALSEGVILRVPGNLSEYCLLLITSNLWKRSKTKILFSPDDGFFNWNYIWSLYLYTTSMLQMEWFLIDNTLRNVSVRFEAILFRVWLNWPRTSWNNWMDKPASEKGPRADLGAIAKPGGRQSNVLPLDLLSPMVADGVARQGICNTTRGLF